MASGIYKITAPSGKFYVGSSKNIEVRWYSHRSALRRNKHGNAPLQGAFNKYGLENIKFSIIEECPESMLTEREMYYILALSPDYNIRQVVDGRWECSEETKKKFSEAKRGHPTSEDTRRRISESNKGKVKSLEHRAKLSESCSGRVVSDETREKLRAAHKGKPKTKAHIESMKRAGAARVKDGGYRHSDETRKKMRESHRLRLEKSVAKGA